MSKNLPKISKDESAVDVRFGTAVQNMVDWVDTTNFVYVGGRGVAKSTVIIARRSLRCIDDMPGAPIAIVANTYSNLVNNIMPAVQNGWKLQGLIEGVHYIKGRRPPDSWRARCSIIVDDYKYCYSFHNGSVLFLGSLDNPSLLAGKSVAHLFFDEAKYASDTRAARVMPILRGDAITYGRSHLYGGVTITTDMPDVTEGEYDWFFRYAAEMDPPRIIKIVQAASLLNDTLVKLQRANGEPRPDVHKIGRIERKRDYYVNGLAKLRRGQTFFANMSSFGNIDILTLDYARRMYEGALEYHEFLKSVLGLQPGVRKSARFYVLFGEDHKYTDGTTSGEAAFDSGQLVYLDPSRPIEGGMDFGGYMNSLVIGQQDGQYYRIHKNFWVITPQYFRQLADQFLAFFSGHQNKALLLYYDRAGNNKQRLGEDDAAKIKSMIERYDDGRRTGWTVRLMSRGQATISQDAEFSFMIELMREQNKVLPLLRVDALNCQEMISSIELARAAVSFARNGRKVVSKIKKSEKLTPHKLPRLSTNLSDAFKYLMMRPTWRQAASARPEARTGVDALVDQWFEDRRQGDEII